MLAYNCKPSFNDSALSYSGRCYHPNMPDDAMDCNSGAIAAAWAIGSEVKALDPCSDTKGVYTYVYAFLLVCQVS